MKRPVIIFLLLLTATVVVRAQDTLYYAANYKRIPTMDSALIYKVYTPDPNRNGNLIETVYFKTGEVLSACSIFFQFKKDANRVVVDSYSSGKISWKNPILEECIERLKDGTYKEWYKSGQLKKNVEYKEGKMNGNYTSFWENGKIKRVEIFDSDKSVEGKCFDQNGKEIKYTVMEQMPEFPGGSERFMKFMIQNLKYPGQMMKEEVQGMVIAQFVVGEDGSLSDIKIIRSLHPALDEEAMRVISKMPNWKPGAVEGEPVSVRVTLPVSFILKGKNNSDFWGTENDNGYSGK